MTPKRAAKAKSGQRSGGPDGLTAKVQEKICDAIRAGNYLGEAAEYAGIGRSTFYRWIQRGQEEAAGKYREFSLAVRKAERDAEAHAVAIIRRHMGSDWKAAMTYLERRFPDRWARRERREITGPDGGAVRFDVEHLADPKLMERFDGLVAELAASRPTPPR